MNTVVFLAGFVALVGGVAAAWSWPLALIVAGVVLMSCAVAPYVRARKG